MTRKILIFIFFLYALVLPSGLIAKEKPFTLNGKPVPKVVAKVNGVSVTSKILERELFAFRTHGRTHHRP